MPIGTLLKDLAKQQILVPHINRYLAKGEFPEYWYLRIKPVKDPDDFSPTFHPSGDCTPCERQLYLKFAEPKKEQLTHTSQKNFAVGNFWHLWLQEIIVNGLGFAEWKDVERRCGLDFFHDETLWRGSGAADIARCQIPGRDEYLIDFKTMNERHFKAEESVIRHLLTKWKYQVNCYMNWVGVDKCIVIGIQKDTPHDFREFVFERDPALLEPVYDKWTNVAMHLRDKMMPAACEHTEAGLVCPV
jgi:hypothetical protein